jgi:hypothetical protein
MLTKKIFLTTLTLFAMLVSGCVNHHLANTFDLVAISTDLNEMENLKIGNIPKRQWSSVINKLKPKSITKTNDGIYIELDAFMTEESGLFYPHRESKVSLPMTDDPSFKLLGNNIYSYYIKG